MNEITRNKILSAISYFSIAWIIGITIEKNNEIVSFHAKQGLILFIYELIGTLVVIIINTIFYLYSLAFFANMFFSITSICFGLTGVYNAVLLRKKKMPIIGNIKL